MNKNNNLNKMNKDLNKKFNIYKKKMISLLINIKMQTQD